MQGTASETDCVFRLREMVRDLAEEMVNLSTMLPPSLNREAVGKDPVGQIRSERLLPDDKEKDKRG